MSNTQSSMLPEKRNSPDGPNAAQGHAKVAKTEPNNSQGLLLARTNLPHSIEEKQEPN
jgi:hypothetical protein